MALTDLKIRTAKPGPALQKLSDGGGLQMWLHPDGARRWRWAYRHDGKQKTLALGVYPAMGLKEARSVRDTAKKQLTDGQDPGAVRKLQKLVKAEASGTSFDAIAAELLAKKRKEAKADATMAKAEWLLRLASPLIGSRPIAEITVPELVAVLKAVEARGRLETAKRLRAAIGQVFRFAMANGLASADPTTALRGTVAAPVTRHRSAIIEPKAFGGLLRAISGYEGAPETRMALELLALTFARPGEMRSAEWAHFDLDAAIWSLPAEKMKMKRPHRVPLAPQAAAILRDLHKLTGGGRYLFPSIRTPTECMSENTLNAALRRLGYGKEEMSAHGFRAAASSMLNESGLWNADAIERQLAHVDNDNVRRAYARADFWEERVSMMTWWADQISVWRGAGSILIS